MRPRSKPPDFGRTFGAVIDVAVELWDRLDHAQIAVGDDARHHERGVIVRIYDRRLRGRLDPSQRSSDGVRRRYVADADARREEQNAN